MPDVSVVLLDHATIRIDSEPSIVAEIADHLSFEAPGAAFDPRVRKGQWDGIIRLVDRKKRTCYAGLSDRIRQLCEREGYGFRTVERGGVTPSKADVLRHMDDIGIPAHFDRRPYQVDTIRRAIGAGRQLFLSPTSSGKSMMMYAIQAWYNLRTLIVVPTTGLTIQMRDDFVSYGCDPDDISIVGGGGKVVDARNPIVIGTWQSIYELEPEWFDQFGLVFGDEAHGFKADSLTGIMMKMRHTALRFGFTGTLDGSKVHQLILEGLFGPTHRVISTAELMEMGYVARLRMECLVLQHPPRARTELRGLIENAWKTKRKQKKGAVAYAEETGFVARCEARNRFLTKMVTKLPGNNLLLFRTIEHGDLLFDMVVAETDRPVHLINGGVDGLERNEIRALIEEADDAILLASLGTTSTGVSIKRINNLIMASPLKGQILTLQSIGRGLRTAHDKDEVTVYDVADELTPKGGDINYGLRHMAARSQIYASEGFDYRVSRVPLGY